jgi:hypothetical protein
MAAMAVLTGCANIQPKIDAFEQQSKRLGVVYAQVNKITPSNDWGHCDSANISKKVKDAICHPNMNAVQVSWVTKSSKTSFLAEAIPRDIRIEPGAIVILDMSKPYSQHFVSVASVEETESCRWDGKRNSLQDSGLRKFTTFTGVFVAVAAAPILGAPVLLHGRNDLGGVVCNGWNYQDAYKDKDIDSLIDIF